MAVTTPIRQTFPVCCALTASGAVRMLPPTRVTNARRSISLYSLDDLVSSGQDRLRDREAERLGGLEIDDQLELGGLLDGEIGGFCTFQDLVDVGCGAPGNVPTARPIRHEATDLRLLPLSAHRRQAALGCEVCDSCSVGTEERVRQDEERVRPLS